MYCMYSTESTDSIDGGGGGGGGGGKAYLYRNTVVSKWRSIIVSIIRCFWSISIKLSNCFCFLPSISYSLG